MGCGLVKGLVELWARHLYETVQPNGLLGFSRFNLWWKQRESSIGIVGEEAGQVKIRRWVFGRRRLRSSSYINIADETLLQLIADKHARLVMRGQTSEDIMMTAHLSNDRKDFIAQIKRL